MISKYLDETLQTEISSLMTTSTSYDLTNNSEQHYCDNCQSSNIKIIGGTYICLECYSQIGNIIDDSGEWKGFGDSNVTFNPRCNSQINPFLPETSGVTFLQSSDGSHRSSNNWQIPHYEKSLKIRLDEIKYFGQLINIPGNTIEFAQHLYVEFIKLQPIYKKKKSSRGDCHTGIIAVCLSLACKEYGLPRSPDEICNKININVIDFTKADNLFFSVMQHSKLIDITNNHYVVKSSDYINNFCRIMGINDTNTIGEIIKIERKAYELKILQKNTPQAIASGCIYFVTKMKNIKLNKSDFDQKCKVSIPTLTKVYEQLVEYTNELI